MSTISEESTPATVATVDVQGREGIALGNADGSLTATFLVGLGMVACSIRHHGDELLAQLGGADAYAERGSTFALPLLHPWANRLSAWGYTAAGRTVVIDPAARGAHRDGLSGMPMHGLLAGSPHWKLQSAAPDGDAARLSATFDFAAHEDLLASFPFPHELLLDVCLRGDSLTMRLTLTATGDVAVPVSFGFHPYLTLPGGRREDWVVQLPVKRRMLLGDDRLPTGGSEQVDGASLSGPLSDHSFDDCFDELEPNPVFSIADARRKIAVAFGEQFDVAQVYAPPTASFICFEPMTAPVDALSTGTRLRLVEPGQHFSAQFTLTVTDA